MPNKKKILITSRQSAKRSLYFSIDLSIYNTFKFQFRNLLQLHRCAFASRLYVNGQYMKCVVLKSICLPMEYVYYYVRVKATTHIT